MLKLFSKSEIEIDDFLRELQSIADDCTSKIKQIKQARNMMNSHFHFSKNESDKKLIFQICEKFPEIRTSRNIETVFYILRGLPCAEIAKKLHVSEKTVKFHKTNIYKAIGVRSGYELISVFYGNELKEPNAFELPKSLCNNAETIF